MYNKVFLIGNLTRDPEVRYTTSGIAVAKFAIAVNRPKGKNSKSEDQEVDFINIVAWRRLAEICKEYLKKGKPVALEGRLQMRAYEKGGEKRTFVEVVADNLQMLGRRDDVKEEIKTGEVLMASSHEENYNQTEEEVPF